MLLHAAVTNQKTLLFIQLHVSLKTDPKWVNTGVKMKVDLTSGGMTRQKK